MKATELRIGNYVHIDYPLGEDGKLIKISPFHLTEMLQCEIAETKHNYIPISLNAYWLDEFGFNDEDILENDNFKLGLGYYDGWVLNYTEKKLYGNGEVNLYPAPIYYVHQLQNLFYSLTETELSLAKNKTETNNANETES
jgi:hypothetical protein